jgi:hypothetical protein
MESLTNEMDTIGFLILPPEVQLLVLCFLDVCDLLQVRLVSWLYSWRLNLGFFDVR